MLISVLRAKTDILTEFVMINSERMKKTTITTPEKNESTCLIFTTVSTRLFVERIAGFPAFSPLSKTPRPSLFVFVQIDQVKDERRSENGSVKSFNRLLPELFGIILKRLLRRFINDIRYILY